MIRTLFTVILALAALTVSAQMERGDSVVGNISVPNKETVVEGRIGQMMQGTSFGDFYGHDFKDFRGDYSLEAKTMETSPYALPTKPENVLIPNLAMYSTHEQMIGLADIRRANFVYGFNTGRWTLEAMASGEKYKFQNATFDNFLLGGSATYRLSPHWSLTAFGQYSTGRYFYSMATYPYISQSQFGATFNYRGNNFGVRLGARQIYDPLRRQWQTEPIIAPQFKLGKLPVEVDFGPLARQILERAVYGKHYNDGPTIMPPTR